MSGFLYPTLPGLDITLKRSYVWKTGYQEALSGKQTTIRYRTYPLVHYELTYSVLRRSGFGTTQDELQAIVGLYNAMAGRFDSFLFTDPEFNTIAPADAATLGTFGTGDGSTTTFQLVATFQNSGGPGIAELIQNLNGTPILYNNGSVISPSGYAIGATGIVTFTAAPASGHALTWSGSWYYRCRFDEDSIEWTRFMNVLWSATCKFTSVKL